MRAKRKDANHNEVAEHIDACGWSVFDTSALGYGFPDLLVGKPGFNCVVEIKDGAKPPSARELTKAERDFRDNWTGPYIVATCPTDALVQLDALYSKWARQAA